MKRVIVLFFVACLIFSLFPIPVIASDNNYPVNYYEIKGYETQWVASLQMPNGAIRKSEAYANGEYIDKKTNVYVPAKYAIIPYLSNFAALALTKDPAQHNKVKLYMQWYFNHLNWTDTNGIYGTVYDYKITDNGVESTDKTYDSIDSYAASFIMLARAYWDTGDKTAQQFLLGNKYQLDVIGNVMVNSIDSSDNLTWAKPNWPHKYLMDNCEVYKGLSDMAYLFKQMGDNGGGTWYEVYANRIKTAITNKELANGEEFYNDKYCYFLNWSKSSPNWKQWYYDGHGGASAEIYPILFGVINPSEDRTQNIYKKICQFDWVNLKVDTFSWSQMGYVALKMNQKATVDTFVRNVYNKYKGKEYDTGLPCAEAAWLILISDSQIKQYPSF